MMLKLVLIAALVAAAQSERQFNICPSRTVYASKGYVVSPNYPQNYPNRKYCTLNVIAGSGYNRLKYLRAVEFRVEGCYDYVHVLGRKHCSYNKPSYGERHATRVKFIFRSDSSVTKKGFKLEFEFTKAKDYCSPNPCQHNSTCYNGGYYNSRKYTCYCSSPLYTGVNCENVLENPCDSQPCGENGACRIQNYYSYYNSGNLTYSCTCDRGWTGRNCETKLPPQPCDSNPCQNGASCYDWKDYYSGNWTYRCYCSRNFTGQHCETRVVDPCLDSPCVNGRCNSWRDYWRHDYQYTCNCEQGYTGRHCDARLPPRPCDSNPCQNGAGCYDWKDYYSGNWTYHCYCSRNFTGQHCETRVVDPCLDSPCVNGQCNSWRDYWRHDYQYTCNCERGYTGRHCEAQLPPRPCESNPCQNGASCYDWKDYYSGNWTYRCYCSRNFTGQNCETRVVDPCLDSPCVNGRCNSWRDYWRHDYQYTCNCERGYTGRHCEAQLPPRPCDSNPCQNDGYCYEWKDYYSGNWTYMCNCNRNFTGQNCETRVVDPCIESPCVNGHCYSWRSRWHHDYSYHCTCNSGFTGQHCEAELPPMPCDSHPCMNNGSCSQWQDYYNGNWTHRCYCPTLFTGQSCETSLDNPCDFNPCLNGGQCTPRRGSYYNPGNLTFTCKCRDGFGGRNCANVVTDFSVCPSRTVYADSGSVVSHNYGSKYSSNMRCTLTVRPRSYSKRYASIDSRRFDVERASSCRYDYLTVTGVSGKLCGRRNFEYSRKYSTYIQFRFSTDGSVQKSGFKIGFRFDSSSYGDEEAPDASMEMNDAETEDVEEIESDEPQMDDEKEIEESDIEENEQ